MEQTIVQWTEDTWGGADDDYWCGADESQADDFHRARQAAILTHKGVILSTCWVLFCGIVATVKCTDSLIRTVPVDKLRIEND